MNNSSAMLPRAYSGRTEFGRAGLSVALALALLLGNFALLCHQYNLAQHATGESCATCVAAHALDHGIAAQIESARVPEQPNALPAPYFTVSFTHSSRFYRARAPPNFLRS